MCSDNLVASCQRHWFPSHTIPVPPDSQYMHHLIQLLPGVTALQQGSDGLPEFTYKPLQGGNGSPTLGVSQEQHRHLQHQHLDPLGQRFQAGSVHQHSLCVETRTRVTCLIVNHRTVGVNIISEGIQQLQLDNPEL